MSVSTYSITHHDLLPPNRHRKDTLLFYQQAVERAIAAMRNRLSEPLRLETLAKIAIESPYHFLRVFEEMTGISPGRFLAALRIEKAKELLLRSELRVTDICFEVGYNSLGTFTRIFTEFVGLSPKHLRRFARQSRINLWEPESAVRIASANVSGQLGVTGQLNGPAGFTGAVFIGLFRTRIPQGRPVAGTLLRRLGSYSFRNAPDGVYYQLAAAFPASLKPLDYLLPRQSSLLVASGSVPIRIVEGRTEQKMTLTLRRLYPTDPPILIALPLLLADR